jgi:alpha-glucosidase
MDGVVRIEPRGRQLIGGVAEFDGYVKLRPEGERYFGCGERTAGLEKTGTRQIFWNVDPPAGHTASFNNLYTSIPFVLCLHEGRAHGVFYDHPGRVELDPAKADPGRVTVAASDQLAVYVLAGPTPADVLER